MKVGKLYKIEKRFWYLYPTKECAAAVEGWPVRLALHVVAPDGTVVEDGTVAYWSDYWSKQLNCNVTYIEPKSIFCLVQEDGDYFKVLTTNGEIGWMIYPENEKLKDDIKEVT